MLSLVAGAASVSVDEEAAGMAFLWGVDFHAYRSMFPDSLTIVEGGFPDTEGSFTLLSERVRSEAEKAVGRRIRPGDKITLGGFGSSGTRLREATVAGIFKFQRGGEQLDTVSLVDAATARSLKGMTAISTASPRPAAEAATTISEDVLFSSGTLTESGAAGSEVPSVDFDISWGSFSPEQIRRHGFERLELPVDQALRSIGLSSGEGRDRCGDFRHRRRCACRRLALGAGMVADLAYSLQIIFNVVVLVVSIVAVIIIMNTLVISVTERIPEIGTIRAIGGTKGFVRSMIVWETLSISVVFGLLGIAVGAAAIGITHYAGIESNNMFFKLLFGGPELRPAISASAVAWSLAATASIGTVSSLYPTAVALKISPVRAMQKA
jgi:putative ABC transport system permease protein